MSPEDHAHAHWVRGDVRWPAVLRIGLIAGTLDITDNLIFNHLRGVEPADVFRYIASGLIGSRAFGSGPAVVAVGVLLHYAIALTWTAIFVLASRRAPILPRRPAASGVVYGGFVYLFMNLVVLPLSGVPRPRAPMTLPARLNGILAVVVFIGLTISYLVRWTTRRLGRSRPIL
jgi:hypothetical protein